MPPSLLLLTDPAGRVLYLNAPARALLGPCEGKRCCDLLRVSCGAGAPLPDPPVDEPTEAAYREVGAVTVNGVHGVASRSAVGGGFVVVVQPRFVHAAALEPLSPREKEALRLVARGHTDAELADRLGIGAATARSYIQNVRKKLGVRSRSQAVALALANGLI